MAAAPADAREAPPFAGPTFGALLDSVWTAGVPGGDDPDGDPTVLTYDESVPGPFSSGYAAPPSMGARLAPGQGVYLEGSGGGVLRAEVRPLREPFTFSLSFTPSGDGGEPTPGDGWNLLGNPYAEPVAWGPAFEGEDVGPTVYVLEPETGRYLYYNRDLEAGTLPGGVLGPFQGFWVIATGPDPELTVLPPAPGGSGQTLASGPLAVGTPAARALVADAGASAASGPGGGPALIGLRLDGADVQAEASVAVVGADRPDLDVVDLNAAAGAPAGLFSLGADQTPLAVQARTLGATDGVLSVPLGVRAPAGGPLTLTWPGLRDVPEAWALPARRPRDGRARRPPRGPRRTRSPTGPRRRPPTPTGRPSPRTP